MAMARFSQDFKLAIAGAPVTDWKLYNSAYTERYLGLLAENKNLYKASSVLTYAESFPDE